jgi:hypothetical protein
MCISEQYPFVSCSANILNDFCLSKLDINSKTDDFHLISNPKLENHHIENDFSFGKEKQISFLNQKKFKFKADMEWIISFSNYKMKQKY